MPSRPILAALLATAFSHAAALPPRVIVHFKADGAAARAAAAPDSRAAVAALGRQTGMPLRYVRTLGDGGHVLQPGAGIAAQQALERLRRDPAVAFAEEDAPVRIAVQPDDPRLPAQWNLHPVETGRYGADFRGAWNAVNGNGTIVVAVIDTGITPHPDLVGPRPSLRPATGALASPGYDFISDCRIRGSCPAYTPDDQAAVLPQPEAFDTGDWVTDADRAAPVFAQCPAVASSWHGTYTAGLIAALGNNQTGIAGAAFGVKILPVRALGKCGGYMSDVADALRWATGTHATLKNGRPARIVNLSLAASGPCIATLQAAIDAALRKGVLVVAAAGNDGVEASSSMLPSCNNVLPVAATTRAGDLAYYSNRSLTHIALSAPGGDVREDVAAGILSLANGSRSSYEPTSWTYVYGQGTSAAAPHVAAAAALLLSREPVQHATVLRRKLIEAATPFPAGSFCAASKQCGSGIVNAGNLFAR